MIEKKIEVEIHVANMNDILIFSSEETFSLFVTIANIFL